MNHTKFQFFLLSTIEYKFVGISETPAARNFYMDINIKTIFICPTIHLSTKYKYYMASSLPFSFLYKHGCIISQKFYLGRFKIILFADKAQRTTRIGSNQCFTKALDNLPKTRDHSFLNNCVNSGVIFNNNKNLGKLKRIYLWFLSYFNFSRLYIVKH